MLKQERRFSISGKNKGLQCPFEVTLCQEGYCSQCQIYLDWLKLGEIVVICAWCGKGLRRKLGLGQSGVSHGICPECKQKHFGGCLKKEKSQESLHKRSRKNENRLGMR